MFVIEKLQDDYRRDVEAWNAACKKWVNGGGEYLYRNEREYREEHPHPKDKFVIAWRAFVIAVCVAAFAALIMLVIVPGAKNHKTEKKEVPVAEVHKNGDDCQGYKVGDHIRIQYGDYEGVTGTLIGGCKQDQDYQIKIDQNQNANTDSDSSTEKVDVSGNIIGVNSHKNIVVIKE